MMEKFTEFLNTLTMKYELRYKCWINTVATVLSAPQCLVIVLLSEYIYNDPIKKLSRAAEILILSAAVGVTGNAVHSCHGTAWLPYRNG